MVIHPATTTPSITIEHSKWQMVINPEITTSIIT